MADRPFGFGPPGDADQPSDPERGSGEPGGPRDFGGPPGGGQPPQSGGPFGVFGDPQQFAAALRQFADMMSWTGGPVNWDLARTVARHTVAAGGDPSVLAAQRQQVMDALRLADLWLEEVTTFPSGVRTAEAWSRAEWVEATFPVWTRLCEPIAAKAVESMGSILSVDPSRMEGAPEELRSALGALGGGLGGLAAMMRQVGGAMIGGQTGAAIGELAGQMVGTTDIGLPLGPEGTAALLPAGVAAFGEGLSVDAEEVRLFLALRETAHHRLFAHVPWLRAHLFGAVEQYARGMAVDMTRLEEAIPQIDLTNPDELREALAGGELFRPVNTPQQQAALTRLETALALVEGWVATVVDTAAQPRLPHAAALAEAVRRLRASGGPAERTFATLVGLELRPRRLREAAELWRRLTETKGTDDRDGVWAHPDLLPTAEDLDDPDRFIRAQSALDIPDLGGSGPGRDEPPSAGGNRVGSDERDASDGTDRNRDAPHRNPENGADDAGPPHPNDR